MYYILDNALWGISIGVLKYIFNYYFLLLNIILILLVKLFQKILKKDGQVGKILFNL